MNRLLWLCLLSLALGACQTLRPSASPFSAKEAGTSPNALLRGEFDNHEQVWSAREASSAIAPPHVVVTLEPVARDGWSIWRIRLDASPAIEATWAMQVVADSSGAPTLRPYRALVADPAPAATFDPKQWTPLDACTLRGAISGAGIRVAADPAACAALAPGIGPSAALLPLDIEREGEWLRVRLYADQARGPDAREATRLVQTFGGWAAVNGTGPNGTPGNDWHMSRTIRLGSEGGRAALAWRDGKPSGYSLALERLTYREGNVPVLKLSVIEDASGRTLAYAWANPEATQIGINLGWLQVGLQRESAAARR